MSSLKKILSVSILVCFAISSIGIGVHKHYCAGYLADISIYLPSDPCGMEEGEMSCHKKKKKCCEDEFQFIQLDQDLQKKELSNLQLEDVFKEIEKPRILTFIALNTKEEIDFSKAKDPPDIHKEPLYQLFQRYTFYG